MIREIIQTGTAPLHQPSQPVPVEDITSPEIQAIIQDMKDTLACQHLGVAIAAPQIGIDKQIFVVAGRIFEPAVPDFAYINPRITKTSRKRLELEEGCLSVDELWGKVERYDKISIEAYDEAGNKVSRGAGGFLAQVMQHEIDHLHGVLFTDCANKTWRKSDKERDEVEAHNQQLRDKFNKTA